MVERDRLVRRRGVTRVRPMSIDIPSSVDAEYAATEEAKFRDYLVGSEGATELLRSLVALDEFKAKPADATQWMRAKTGSQDLSCLVHGVEAPDVRGMLKENAKLKQKLEVFTEQLQKLTQELGPRLALGAFRTPIATEPPLESWMPEYVVRKANIGKQTFSLCALSSHPNWRLCCANEEPHATMVHARWYSCADVVCLRVRACACAADGRKLAYIEQGEADAPQTVLAIHGVDCGKEVWLLPKPLDGVRIIGVDRPGHGDSDKPAGQYGYAQSTADLLELVVRPPLFGPLRLAMADCS